jgi:hypothetical protein
MEMALLLPVNLSPADWNTCLRTEQNMADANQQIYFDKQPWALNRID